MDIGRRISSLRNEKKINQRDFAEILGVSNGAVGMWETNKRQPDLETIKNIASFFNVTTDYLLGISNNKNEKENIYSFFDDMLRYTFMTRIKEAMNDNNISLKELAVKTTINVENCQAYLNGKQEPSLENLISLSHGLDVPVDYLLGQIPKVANSEKKFLDAFVKLTEDNKDIIIGKIKELLKEQNILPVETNEPVKRTGTNSLGK